tara:strand:- start:12505 stop:13785 length:1281 start_codon:yes stop_codon:yes gene_type:complete
MSVIDIKVPNIGDFKDVEIIEILVKIGQEIIKGDSIITLESDKSSVEVPSDHSGKISNINVKVGDKVSEGDLILKIELFQKENIQKDIKQINDTKEIQQPIEKPLEKKEIKTNILNIDKTDKLVLASPRVRKFARELGADINIIPGSEKFGRVSEEDVKNFIKVGLNQKEPLNKDIKNKNLQNKIEYSHSEFGEIDVKDIPRIKKLAAPHLVNSFNTIPHVTHHDEIDITEMEEFRNSLTDYYTGEKLKITPLAFIMKALVAALKKFPSFNSSIEDMSSGKITFKKYFHIGIAVDTPNGLMVPKIRQVEKKNIQNLSSELREVAQKCRDLKIDKKEFYGGSMTISSLGGIGGSFFTPIINYPEVAILGVSKSNKKQILLGDRFTTRTILPISLSYDHRIIDGAEAARFCNEIRDNLGKNFAFKLAI